VDWNGSRCWCRGLADCGARTVRCRAWHWTVCRRNNCGGKEGRRWEEKDNLRVASLARIGGVVVAALRIASRMFVAWWWWRIRHVVIPGLGWGRSGFCRRRRRGSRVWGIHRCLRWRVVEMSGIILWSDPVGISSAACRRSAGRRSGWFKPAYNFGRRTAAGGTIDGIIRSPTLPLMVAGVAVQSRVRHVCVSSR